MQQIPDTDLLWLLLARQNGRCFICGGECNLEIHHLIPRGSGGINHLYNCILVCGPTFIKTSCHFKIHHASMSQYSKYKKYICNGYFKWFKLKKIVMEIKAREREKSKWLKMK
mgnify:CR=1 FL=1